jgi:hypothetical protein
VTVLPRSLREDLARQMERARDLWSRDREANGLVHTSPGQRPGKPSP